MGHAAKSHKLLYFDATPALAFDRMRHKTPGHPRALRSKPEMYIPQATPNNSQAFLNLPLTSTRQGNSPRTVHSYSRTLNVLMLRPPRWLLTRTDLTRPMMGAFRDLANDLYDIDLRRYPRGVTSEDAAGVLLMDGQEKLTRVGASARRTWPLARLTGSGLS